MLLLLDSLLRLFVFFYSLLRSLFVSAFSCYRWLRCSNSCFTLAGIYLFRYLRCENRRGSYHSLTPWNAHRLSYISLIIGAKYLDDYFPSNAVYAKVGGMTLSKLNEIERQFLHDIEYNVFVSTKQFKAQRHLHLCLLEQIDFERCVTYLYQYGLSPLHASSQLNEVQGTIYSVVKKSSPVYGNRDGYHCDEAKADGSAFKEVQRKGRKSNTYRGDRQEFEGEFKAPTTEKLPVREALHQTNIEEGDVRVDLRLTEKNHVQSRYKTRTKRRITCNALTGHSTRAKLFSSMQKLRSTATKVRVKTASVTSEISLASCSTNVSPCSLTSQEISLSTIQVGHKKKRCPTKVAATSLNQHDIVGTPKNSLHLSQTPTTIRLRDVKIHLRYIFKCMKRNISQGFKYYYYYHQ